MKEIIGDILDITEGVICHQVNCQKVAGAGLALAIRKKYPNWYDHFLKTQPVLGEADFFMVNSNLGICLFLCSR